MGVDPVLHRDPDHGNCRLLEDSNNQREPAGDINILIHVEFCAYDLTADDACISDLILGNLGTQWMWASVGDLAWF